MFQIKQIDEDDWHVFRDVRLRALTADPAVFAASVVRESSFPETIWRSRLQNADMGIFIVYADCEPAGMTGIVIDRDDPSKQTALLWGSWLRPDLRRQGLSKQLYEARIAWARRHPTCKRMVVSHRESNVSSRFANQKHSFRWTYSKERIWNDGLREKEHFYELILEEIA